MRIPSGAIPENIRRCMTKEERKEMRTPTSEEAQSKIDVKSERQLHKQFESWCRLNGIVYLHSRMDSRPTIREGWPDFTCFFNGRCCFVEFKMPHAKPTQIQDECCQSLNHALQQVLVTDSLVFAITWVKEALMMV